MARRTRQLPRRRRQRCAIPQPARRRLGAKGAHDIIAGRAGLDDPVTAHVLRHSFATTLVRGKTDLVLAAELLGHARIETTRLYTQPTAEDRAKAIDPLVVDE